MQVNDVRVKNNTPFEFIGIGEVFSWKGELYMRTRLCKSSDVLCNTVSVVDGGFAFFENSDCVEKLNAEITIR